MKKKGRFVGIILILVCQSSLFAQQDKKAINLERIYRQAQDAFYNDQLDIHRYIEENQVPSQFVDQGVTYSLVRISSTGVPIYIKTHNKGAAKTVGADALRPGGELGLNLTGSGMTVGVWDAGIVRPSHVELIDRVLQQDGASSLSDHATHVTGTIIAAGINSSAQGMAYEANGLIFDFNNDLAEIASRVTPDQSTLLLSNHSYGTVTGWEFNNDKWQWYGDPSVSPNEDYKFGFYDSRARNIDNICHNAPYYTVVKSAGNDRTDVGDGTRASDGPYDCISTMATAKNIITVGAIEKIVNEYTSPADAVMSTFSSWGPTDDGRIKPDIVGAGVGVFSTFSSSDEAYSSLQGTSMSTPNVTGSLVLLQQLAMAELGTYLKSATLKALVIHTAKEAGTSPGPDYRFGWGVLDVKAAAKVILENDTLNQFIQELTLNNGGTIEIDVYPQAGSDLMASIAWTDLPGSSPSISLDPTDLMLVNDLDIRITDDTGAVVMPWVLTPDNPGVVAARGDNNRDNVERVELDQVEPRKYTIRISHKGNLIGGSQDFSLIISQKAQIDPSAENVLFFIDNDGTGDWNNPMNWSYASGGVSANVIPGIMDHVIVDENSFLTGNHTLNLSTFAECKSFTWLRKELGFFAPNAQRLAITDFIELSTDSLKIENTGSLTLDYESRINLNNNDLRNLSITFNNPDATWQLTRIVGLDSIIVLAGNLIMTDSKLKINGIATKGVEPKTISITNSMLDSLQFLNLEGDNLTATLENSKATFYSVGVSQIKANNIVFNSTIENIGTKLLIEGVNNQFKSLRSMGDLEINGSHALDTLTMEAGSMFTLHNGDVLTIQDALILHSEPDKPVSIICNDGQATVELGVFDKFCFDYLRVENVEATGQAVISAGLNSEVINANNWEKVNCQDVLFANFSVENTCAGGLTQFVNRSSGDIESNSWDLGDGSVSDLQDPLHSFANPGIYEVALTISNPLDEVSVNRIIEVQENTIAANTIVLANNALVSSKTSDSYQWYRNAEPISGGTQRSIALDQSGVYFVVIRDATCNRKSNEFEHIITGLGEEAIDPLRIYPNPAHKQVMIEGLDNTRVDQVYMVDQLGQLIPVTLRESGGGYLINLEYVETGIYTIRFVMKDQVIIKTLLIYE